MYQKRKEWEGTFKFIHIDDETAAVQMNHGRWLFRYICVTPFAKSLIPRRIELSPDIVQDSSEAHTAETSITDSSNKEEATFHKAACTEA